MNEIPVFLKKVLYKRGIKGDENIRKFLFSTFNDLTEPEIIGNIENAACEIIKEIERKGRIFVYGDGDIDGIGGVFFILKFFQNKNVNFNYYLTHRLEDYEIEEKFVEYLLKEKYNLLILIDCGISSYKFLKKCAENNIKVIVVDHHQGDIEKLPDCHIYIHPYFCPEEFDFSATGLSFKLFQNLISNSPSFPVHDYISIAGLAVLSENVTLLGDNRVFVKEMLKDLKHSKIKGLNFIVSKYLNEEKIETEDVKKMINPKLNSPGRFGKPEVSLNLLLEEEEKEIEILLEEIDSLDRKRYKITQKIIKNIEKQNGFENRFLILENFPESLCGIIASRLVEKYNLPFIVMSKKGDIVKGSGRSPEDFNLYENMKFVKEKFLSFGGHKNAIGFKFKIDKKGEIEKYWESIKIVDRKGIKDDHYDTILEIDEIKPDIFEYLNLLKPYGKGNNPPVFLSRNVLIKKINKGNEVKYWAKKGDSIFECKISDVEISEGIKDILYTPEMEKIDGYYKITIEIKGIK